MDSSIWVILALNIGLIMAFSWFGLKIFNKSVCYGLSRQNENLSISRIIKERSIITPRLRKIYFLRRMIKNSFDDDDETPFLLPQ